LQRSWARKLARSNDCSKRINWDDGCESKRSQARKLAWSNQLIDDINLNDVHEINNQNNQQQWGSSVKKENKHENPAIN
jgi:hypothetical protein